MSWLERLSEQWGVIKKAPLAFLTFVVIGAGAGYVGSTWYYSKQITDKDGQIARYRLALGIDKASEGALIELTNTELRAKAIGIASKLRETCLSMTQRQEAIQVDFTSGKISKKDQTARHNAVLRDVSREFAKNLRPDAVNVENELKRRLDPKARASIVGVLPSFVTGDGTVVGIVGLTPIGSGFDSFYLCQMAEEIDQMARMLPPDA